jgi:hypothetical protein
VNALANADVGDYLNKHFTATFQKVGSFRVAGAQKQGGNVASYFCTPDGGVLDAVAGPVDASTLLREARWVVETRKMALLESGGDVNRYRLFLRMAHAQRLADEDGVTDVNWRALPLYRPTEAALESLLDNDRHARQLNQQGRVHLLLAAFPLVKLDQAYKVVYERILNEQVTTAPVVEGNAPQPGTAVRLSLLTRPAQGPVRGMGGYGGMDLAFAGVGALSPEEARQQARALELSRALGNPPLTEVYSGQALNVLLGELVQRQEDGSAARAVRLPAEVLAHVNVTTEHDAANAGLLRDGGTLSWPAVWREAPLRQASRQGRASLDRLLPEAVTQAKKGPVDEDTLDALRRDLVGLQRVLEKDGKDLEASRHIQATRFLGQVDDALRVLEGQDAARYLGGALTLDPGRIKTVADLVRFLTERGLIFAPAVSGDEEAYAAVRRALAGYVGSGDAPAPAAGAGQL